MSKKSREKRRNRKRCEKMFAKKATKRLFGEPIMSTYNEWHKHFMGET